MKKTLICGAGGFIGSHLVKKLKDEGFWVRGVDLKYPEFSETKADDFIIGDHFIFMFVLQLITIKTMNSERIPRSLLRG